ncbi:single-strand DNA-binding protein [Mycolicibacterium sp. BK634]|uniref:single-stranded DNA-binding protein n=1 Tax=Mycolicibacterium sp. BK634 TaxID=2587099 RepID=UPI00160B0681|nr:single-stranded DNA-binding protein [Mycolicibacterium sp. BK634]MBB3750841.1 single-strand DNA-binding protein [Mycolicibacterium sp. BK634]
MFETHLTVVGRVVTDPRRRVVGDQELISFRVASNSRRRTGEGTWEPGNSLYITVNCWGKLVTGVGAGLYKGAPVIVVGDVFTSEYDDKEGVRRSSLEMRATAVGPDLSRAIIRYEQPQPRAAEPAAEEPAAGEPLDTEDADETTGLPLSA